MYELLRHLLMIAATLGFGFLFWRYLTLGMFWRVPFFTSYAGAAFLYGLFYDPNHTGLLFFAQPILLSLRVSMAIEAFILATETIAPRARRWAFLATISPSVAITLLVRMLGIYPDWYHATRLYVHTGLAAACLFGAFALWIEPPRMPSTVKAHCLTMACYFSSHAIVNLAKPENLFEWQYLNTVSLAACCVYIWYWLRCGLASRVHPLLKVINPVS